MIETVLIGLLLGLGAAGCATETPVAADQGSRSEAAKSINVVKTSHVLTLSFSADDLAPTPGPGHGENLDDLLASGDIAEGDQALIERGPGVLADARARSVAGGLRRQGLKVEIIETGRTPVRELRVVVAHLGAVVKSCPDWSDVTGDGPRNAMPRDFGCAVAGDLAAMVVDPHDLILGRRLAPEVGDAALYAMRRYRYGDPASPSAAAPVNIMTPTTSNATAPNQLQTAPPAAVAAPPSANPAVPPLGPGAPSPAAAPGVTPSRPS